MSPRNNSNHQLADSYQHCPEHEALCIGEDNNAGNIESGVDVDVDVDVIDHHRHHHQHQQQQHGPKDKQAAADIMNITERPSSLTEHFNMRNKSYIRNFLLLAGIIAAFRWSWFALCHSDEAEAVVSTEQQQQQDSITATHEIPDLIWSDEFDGDSVDLTKWTFVNGNGCDVGLCGWGNNEREWYTPSNARVSDGKLVVKARKFVTHGGPPSYTSSKIISRGKADFGVVDATATAAAGNKDDDDSIKKSSGGEPALEKSRRFESRMKLPWGNGIWPAFWMLPTYDTYGGWPRSGEIDIMESIGKEGNTVHGTVHYGLEWPHQHQYAESGVTLSKPETSSAIDTHYFGNLNETYHTYAVERLPGIIRWYIDDIEYSSITKEDTKPYHWPFDEEFYFIFNLAVGGNWPGDPLDEDGSEGDATAFPQVLELDYVRVYEGVFPRIVGKSEVDCSEQNIVYEVANADAKGASYTWTVPQNAQIKEGQGTARITVNFDFTMMESNMIENEVIHVQASGIGTESISASTGLAKLQESGIGIRIKIGDFEGKCSNTNKDNAEFKTFEFDCGRPETCTQYVLHRTTEEFTCGERIEWLINENGMDENEACRKIGYEQFNGHCGPCNPLV